MNTDYKIELVDNEARYPGAAEPSMATAQWVSFYNRERPHSYCHDLTPDHAEKLRYTLDPEAAFTVRALRNCRGGSSTDRLAKLGVAPSVGTHLSAVTGGDHVGEVVPVRC